MSNSIKTFNEYKISENEILMWWLGGASFYLKNLNIDMALIAANGKDGNLTQEEGVLLTNIIRPKVVIPMHYGILPFTNFDPNILRDVFEKNNVKSELKILNIGDFYIYKKSGGK